MKIAMLTDTYDNIGGTEQAIKILLISFLYNAHSHS